MFERNETDGLFSAGPDHIAVLLISSLASAFDGFDLIAVEFDKLSPVPFYVSEVSGRDPVHDGREIENSYAASPAGSQIKLRSHSRHRRDGAYELDFLRR